MTGYGWDSDIARAREAGFDAHLVKPYEVDELEKSNRKSAFCSEIDIISDA